MQCEQFQERLQLVMDDRRSPSDDVDLQSHASRCAACAVTLRFSTQLGQLWATNEDDPSLDFCNGKTTKPKRDSAVFLKWAAASVVAASCLLAWILPKLNLQGVNVASGSQSVPAVVADGGARVQPNSSVTLSQSQLVLDPSQSPFVHQPLISLGFLSRQQWEYSMDEVQLPFAANFSSIGPDWIDAVSDGMAPVQESVSKTLGAIRRSLSS